MSTLKRLKEFLGEQTRTSAGTSLNQIPAGVNHALKHGWIKPNSTNIDVGGGKYDKAKNAVESSVAGAKYHVHDKFNRDEKHNAAVDTATTGKCDYAGCHNVLNVIEHPKDRKATIEKVKSSLHPKGIAHFTTYEGNGSGEGKPTQNDGSWQNNRKTKDYHSEIHSVFGKTHNVEVKGKNIIATPK